MFKGRLWIFLVLTSFVLLLVPKNVWHDCDRSHAVEHSDHPRQKYFENGKCSICDFQFFAATVHHFPLFRFEKTKYFTIDFLAKDQCTVFLTLLQLRGPPQWI